MKPLLAQQVQRGSTLNEWQSGDSQLTVDGLNAFAARQRQRMAEAAERRNESQWAMKDREAMSAQPKPPLVFNRIKGGKA